MRRCAFYFLCLMLVVAKIFSGKLFSENISQPNISSQTQGPWLAGPLIAPPGIVVPRGQYLVQNYFYLNTVTGFYDASWDKNSVPNFFTLNPQIFAIIGLTPWMDFQIIPQVLYNHSQGQDDFNIGDLIAGFDFQLFSDTASMWFPGIKFSVIETFPLGKYKKLNPKKAGTQVTGAGAFTTNFDLVFYKVYQVMKEHYLSFTLSFADYVSTSVNVQGFNSYGGGYGTHGKIYPGNSLQTIMSFEFTLNQNWVLALDNVYIHTAKTRFSGHRGVNLFGEESKVGLPSSEQFSMAPAIEYNFSANFSISAGAWVSVVGRNSAVFRNAVVNIEAVF